MNNTSQADGESLATPRDGERAVQSSEQVRSALRSEIANDEAAVKARAVRQVRMRKIKVRVSQLLLGVVILGGWQILATDKVIDPFFFGTPTGVVSQLVDWFQHGTEFGSIWTQIGVTMEEALLGFVYGVLAGVVLGVVLGQFKFLADVIGPYIKIVNAVPRIVLGSLFVVWLGLGTPAKVLLASVLVFFVVFFNAFQGVREVDVVFLNNAKVLGASRLQIIRHVVLPSALTWITASLHVAFGFAVIGAIVGEFLGAQQGLGLVISSAQGHFDPNGVFAAMVIIGAIALTAEFGISFAEKKLLAWRPASRQETAGM
ncbi:ABC transporter permease [Streptacidiphilus fuscans]|uniref:ABC transporter permease n=1 Tax=Streptacidiphilus fuscans TaxID=2789292 RepID=A0A931B9D2_9ACTN|nr:ABC transporter permease [Streptacidiphilus fuscans]MBF9072491.1 ABC transporter permease [Streptacidiphilus fuscans]